MSLGIIAMLLQIGKRPLSYVIPNAMFIIVAAMILALCYHLSRKGRVRTGSIVFIVMITIACVGAVIVGGTRGALPVILIIPIATAGVTLGSGASLILAILSVSALVISGFLEINNIIHVDYPAPEMVILLNMFDVGFGFFFVTMGIWLASYSLQQALERTRQANVEASGYRLELEKSLTAEQAARDRLQKAITEYTTFLEQIGQGDYKARLSLAEEDENLVILEQHINATVDTLVEALARTETALQEVEAAHRHYVLQTWRDYVRSRPTADFETGQPNGIVPREQLLAALKEAVAQRQTLTFTQPIQQEETDGLTTGTALVTPIMLRGEVIGTLSICRESDKRPWTDEERDLVEAVAERLALAAENQRLYEDSQRRAARERTVGEIATRIRETLDVETVLRTATEEIYNGLGLDEIVIHLDTEATDNQDTTIPVE